MTDQSGPIGPQHDEARWLEKRREGIGASEVPAILGTHPFLTERDVYFNKVGGQEQEVTPFMERGRYLESAAADLYQRETGRTLRRIPLLQHKELPILMATLDRQILASDDNPTAGLELKVPAWQTFAKVRAEGLPAHWILQAQTQAMVTGYPFIAFGILNADAWKMVVHDFEPIADMSEMILNRVGEWWEKHIIAGTPPAPKITPPIELPEVPVSTDIITRDDPLWHEATALFREGKDILAQAKELDKTARDRLKGLMVDGGHSVAEGGGMRVYYRMKDGRLTIDKKELKVRALDRDTLIHDLVHEHGWPISEAQDLAEGASLDLDTVQTRGNAYAELRPYIIK